MPKLNPMARALAQIIQNLTTAASISNFVITHLSQSQPSQFLKKTDRELGSI